MLDRIITVIRFGIGHFLNLVVGEVRRFMPTFIMRHVRTPSVTFW